MTQPRLRNSILLCSLALVVTLLVVPLIGSTPITLADIRGGTSSSPTLSGHIFWTLRLPRAALAAIAGAALAVAGCVFQALLRNPLAEPFTLGVASGASLGAALGWRLGWTGVLFLGVSQLTVMAFGGALFSVALVYAISRLRSGSSTNTLLLGGVAIGFVCAAIIVLIEFLSARPVTNQIVRWLMGSLDKAGPAGLFETLPPVAVGLAVVWYLHQSLDLLMMGDAVAAGRGVNVHRARRAAYLGASLMTAAVVAQCGPIAFVGLLVPHVVRSLVGPMHRGLLPAAALAGAALLPWCDVIAANLLRWMNGAALQIPVGVVTNLLGGLFFVYLLLTRRDETVLGGG